MINIPGLAPKKRPLAESYVNTGAAGVLAVMKMLETLAALLGIVMLVFVSDPILHCMRRQEAFRETARDIRQKVPQ